LIRQIAVALPNIIRRQRCALRLRSDGVAFTGQGKLFERQTGSEQQEADATLSRTGARLREPSFRPAVGAYRRGTGFSKRTGDATSDHARGSALFYLEKNMSA
jgi:hypothetical protein